MLQLFSLANLIWQLLLRLFEKCVTSLSVLSADMCANIINGLRDDHDGCDSGYGPPVRRGRNGFSIGYFLDISLDFVLHSSLSPSAGVLVHRSRPHLSPLDSLYVPPLDPLLHH